MKSYFILQLYHLSWSLEPHPSPQLCHPSGFLCVGKRLRIEQEWRCVSFYAISPTTLPITYFHHQGNGMAYPPCLLPVIPFKCFPKGGPSLDSASPFLNLFLSHDSLMGTCPGLARVHPVSPPTDVPQWHLDACVWIQSSLSVLTYILCLYSMLIHDDSCIRWMAEISHLAC